MCEGNGAVTCSPSRVHAAGSTSAATSSASDNSADVSNGDKLNGVRNVKQQNAPTAEEEEAPQLRKALPRRHGVEWRKEHALDVIWWMKQIIAGTVGTLLGLREVTGWLGFLIFASVQFLTSYLWAERVHLVGICLDRSEIILENIVVSSGTFLVFWILSYTLTVSHLGE